MTNRTCHVHKNKKTPTNHAQPLWIVDLEVLGLRSWVLDLGSLVLGPESWGPGSWGPRSWGPGSRALGSWVLILD